MVYTLKQVDRPVQNQFIADRLRETANLLGQQGANRFRVAAYRKAAGTVESLTEDVTRILETKGFDGLTALPGIGVVIGNAIVEILTTGGVGPKLARRIIRSGLLEFC